MAKSPDTSQLSFLWYETDTGRMEDMRAVNRGTETGDYMLCDTSNPGTRNYLCMVETSNGGVAYSSIVPVTVTEKVVVPQAPTETQTVTSPTTEPAAAQTQPTIPTEIIQNTTAPAEIGSLDTSVPTEAAELTEVTTKDRGDPTPQSDGLPWWILVLIGAAAAGVGVGTAIVLIKK